MEESPLEAIPALGPQKRPVNRRFIYLVLTIVVLIIAYFSYQAFGPKSKHTLQQKAILTSSSAKITPTLTPMQTPIPTPSVSPTPNPVDKATGLDRSNLSIIVQNGSGEEGVAGKAFDFLKSLGYSLKTSENADNFNYQDVVIQVKPEDSDYLKLLQKDLGFNYKIGSTSADLPASFSADALVIIGK